MKKIIALFVMLFAFTSSMNAQDKNEMLKKAAEKDVKALTEVVTLSTDVKDALTALFMKKHDALSSENFTEAKKRDVQSIIEAKLRATLTDEQMQLVDRNQKLLNQLIGASQTK